MAMGIILALVAGSLVSLQNIFNSKMNEKTGSWSTTAIVLGLGFLASFTLGAISEGAAFFRVSSIKPWYLFSGLIGVGVVICLVRAFRLAGPTFSVSLVMTAQLGTALILDSVGALGLERVPFSTNKLIGVLIIIGGVLVYQMGGKMNPLHAFARKSIITNELSKDTNGKGREIPSWTSKKHMSDSD
ncbi:DMT family transporter [Gorillibacterium timonense]|uniref:DMT family transporter n=1 Tax=Gorillibacterium timonense TaxID=1689269 RepID=UPI0009EC3B22|nr:DMT family transporter [Gorillibacterium timonense]